MPPLEDFPFKSVAEWLRDGTIIPFLGSGASVAGVDHPDRLPTGAGLAGELVSSMDNAYKGSKNDALPKVAQYYEKSLHGRRRLHEFLHNRFGKVADGVPLAAVPRFLADLAPSTRPFIIVTTNYDTQVEAAFKGKRPLFVITQHFKNVDHRGDLLIQEPQGGDRWLFTNDLIVGDRFAFPEDAVFLYKMHGSAHWHLDDPRFNVVITEDDYVDMLIRCGAGPASYIPPNTLKLAFTQRQFLFLGYALEDWNFRVLLGLLENRNALSSTGPPRHYAVQRETSPIDEELWKQRGVTVYQGDLADFCKKLSSAMGGGDK